MRANKAMIISGITIRNVNTFDIDAKMLTAQLSDNSLLTITDSTFEGNYYLALWFDRAPSATSQQVNASVVFRNCIFRNNRIGTNAMVTVKSLFGVNTLFDNCVFEGNRG